MPLRKKLLWRLYISYILLILLAVVAITGYSYSYLRDFYLENHAKGLHVRVLLLDQLIDGRYNISDSPEIDAICKTSGQQVGTRFTVILPDGKVIADTKKPPETMDNHATRPEIMSAYNGDIGVSTRHSATLGNDLLYVAVPVEKDGKIIAVVRAATELPVLANAVRMVFSKILMAGLVVALVAAGLAFLIASKINRPLQEMREGAARFAQGDLNYRLHVPEAEETQALALAMNKMAAQLDERIATITHQRNELEAVLSGMVEAVVVLDSNKRIVRFNEAAAKLFKVEPSTAGQRTMEEITDNPDLLLFLEKLYTTGQITEEELIFQNGEEKCLQAYGTFIRDAQGESLGVLFVLNDVTRLKKLETVRRDFVANVSHELKTPITSIKGSVETLLDGAVNDSVSAIRFLEIISNHSDRLNAIIDDLLSLSRIEQGDNTKIEMDQWNVKDLLRTAIETCDSKLKDKNITVTLNSPENLFAVLNHALIEQAVVNLIDNAIKYSNPESEIVVTAEKEQGNLHLQVSDTGCGIPAEHLPRLFERFYRVDKARSRSLGGTGLGLAIVKHIVSAHKGKVSVKSEAGKGSVFTIILPIGI